MSTKYSSDTISLWHRTATDAAVVATLKANIEALLDLEEGMHLEYENFKEAMAQPKKEPRQFQKREGDWSRGRGRGRGGRYNNNYGGGNDDGNNFNRSAQPAQQTGAE
mmetsp:Transcript_624/g.837  ORF Transcript_624/g.837 Transcript_624/m.837 type:complete len:108 (-) Transcript_624:88-411(-)